MIKIQGATDLKGYSIPSVANKCVRFLNDIIEEVKEEIEGTQCTFTAFVIEAVRSALESLKEYYKQEDLVYFEWLCP